jgi:hypothetical protein
MNHPPSIYAFQYSTAKALHSQIMHKLSSRKIDSDCGDLECRCWHASLIRVSRVERVRRR